MTILVARVRCSRVNGVLKPQVGEQTPAARCARLIAVAAPIPWFAAVTITTCPRSTTMRLDPFPSAKKADPPHLTTPLATPLATSHQDEPHQSTATWMRMSHTESGAQSGGKISAIVHDGTLSEATVQIAVATRTGRWPAKPRRGVPQRLGQPAHRRPYEHLLAAAPSLTVENLAVWITSPRSQGINSECGGSSMGCR